MELVTAILTHVTLQYISRVEMSHEDNLSRCTNAQGHCFIPSNSTRGAIANNSNSGGCTAAYLAKKEQKMVGRVAAKVKNQTL